MTGAMDKERDEAAGRGDDARIAAYLDDEMGVAERAGFDARLAGEPALAAAVARERGWRAQLAQAFDPVLDEPVPERLTVLFDRHAPVRPEATGSTGSKVSTAGPAPASPATSAAPVDLQEERRRRRGWWAWGGMAASLALGMLIGAKGLAPDGELAHVADGGWMARGALAEALEEQVSGAPSTGAGPRVGMSFQARDGRYCRAFVLDGSGAGAGSAGLACRGDDGWRVRQLASTAPAAAGPDGSAGASDASEGFRMAASPWPKALLDDIDGLREGDALSPEAERAAAARHWRR